VGGGQTLYCQPSHKLILILYFLFIDLKILKEFKCHNKKDKTLGIDKNSTLILCVVVLSLFSSYDIKYIYAIPTSIDRPKLIKDPISIYSVNFRSLALERSPNLNTDLAAISSPIAPH
jgi:uncharacterized membrane protein